MTPRYCSPPKVPQCLICSNLIYLATYSWSMMYLATCSWSDHIVTTSGFGSPGLVSGRLPFMRKLQGPVGSKAPFSLNSLTPTYWPGLSLSVHCAFLILIPVTCLVQPRSMVNPCNSTYFVS